MVEAKALLGFVEAVAEVEIVPRRRRRRPTGSISTWRSRRLLDVGG